MAWFERNVLIISFATAAAEACPCGVVKAYKILQDVSKKDNIPEHKLDVPALTNRTAALISLLQT